MHKITTITNQKLLKNISKVPQKLSKFKKKKNEFEIIRSKQNMFRFKNTKMSANVENVLVRT